MALGNSGKTEIDHFVAASVLARRKAQGMSQAKLAVKLDVSAAFIGQIEDPEKNEKYNLFHLNQLAKIFGCSPKDFLPEKPL